MATIDTKKIVKKAFSFIFIIFLILFIIGIYLFYPRNVKIFSELEPVQTERNTTGHIWKIIPTEKARIVISAKYQIKMPRIDFSKYYLLWGDGRRIKSLTYTLGSKLFNCRDIYSGSVTFEKNHYPHKAFFYKIERMYLLDPI